MDFLAILPFDKIFKGVAGFNKLTRILRLPKLYKLIKMTRLVRMLKIVKERNKLVKALTEILRIGVGFERLLFFILIFLIMCHIVACLWIFASRFKGDPNDEFFCEEEPNNWACAGGFEFDITKDNTKLYFVSFYFTVTTITTVGYGDISAKNTTERIISCLLMITGVIGFSFATGSLSSIMTNYD